MKSLISDNYLNCFGDFDANDPICTKLCAINIRCCIERDEKIRMEIIDDLLAFESSSVRIQ